MKIKQKFGPVYLNALGIISALGSDGRDICLNLLKGHSPDMGMMVSHLHGREYFSGVVKGNLPKLPDEISLYDCRNSRLSLAALSQIRTQISEAIDRYGENRIGVVMGSSTSSVDEMEIALQEYVKSGLEPMALSYFRQEVGTTAEVVAQMAGVCGPTYAVSTACSSSGKVLASARGLIELGLCDAVLVGGTDSLCELTLNGFSSLEAISQQRCNPFSKNRNGINIGEGSAIFLMSREAVGPSLIGVGESCDAYHMVSPDPSGQGAVNAICAALEDAKLVPDNIDYINLHGTATAANDLMESRAVNHVFGVDTLCSSTKPLTGHALGAAGAIEAGLCWLLLECDDRNTIAPHIYDGVKDSDLSPINLCTSSSVDFEIKNIMSNSFAFGGNNVSIILSRNEKN